MEAKLLSSPLPPAFMSSALRRKSPPLRSTTTLPSLRRTRLAPISSANSHDSNPSENEDPPRATNIRYRPRSRRDNKKKQQQRRQEEEEEEGGLRRPKADPKKKWEEMDLGEKALEAYMGEKGLLFWLNKFAYASIFAVVGGWILFRFVGPSLGLYRLDSPPLPPTSVFKGD
ncbi:hypothetical protein AXF42_Ash012357 [Apostasia shenzhenica]|uniref:Uncharacterized protein n=1 Tax=Apostasia shenzhenica TaxID=1088818 RepID=A0A2I0AD24_9ASPA|nr:hypothetical protein AXF42_Ash012357 [Apostasia shenzhenica]